MIPFLIGGGVILASAAATYYFWEKIKKKVLGKNIVVLGQRASGKTTLLNYLMTGEVVTEYEQTILGKKIRKTKNFKLSELPWRISSTMMDVGANEDNYKKWRELVRNADVVVYTFRADLWSAEPDLQERNIENQLALIKNELKPTTHTFIVGTHLDKEPYINNLKTNEEKQEYVQEFLSHNFLLFMKEQLGGSHKCVVVLDNTSAENGLSRVTNKLIESIVE